MASTYTINNLAQPSINTSSITSGGTGWTTGSTVTLTSGAGANGTYLTTGAGVGGAGQIYTTNGTSNSWITPNNYDQVLTVSAGKSHPTLDVKGNLVINGVDLEERLKTIEKVLQIPERDVN
jgi:hypothetical protein